MQANYFDRLSLGTFSQGQGSQNAVEQAHWAALRALAARLASKLARGLSLPLGHWHALSLKRMPAAMAPAMCPIIADGRRQRVVVTRGTVGVC
jgi:hypothetical protein